MIFSFDDDLAGEATRASNRLRLLTQIHPSLERVLGEQTVVVPGTSDPTISRLIDTLAASGEKALRAIRSARSEARHRAWSLAMGNAPDADEHHFEVGGRQLYTWCALDTLVFPAVVARPR